MREKVFPILIAVFLLASLAPTFYEIAHRDRLPPIREFELVHNFPTDFNFYLSRIRQGIEGRSTLKEQYTSEPHQGSFIHVFYLLLGWLGRWSRVPWERGGDVYHVARVVFGGLLLVMIGEFCKRAFEKRSMNYELGIRNKTKNDFLPSSYFIIRNSKFALLSYLLSVTASTWPKLVSLVNDQIVPATWNNIAGWRLGGYMSWWSVMDSLQRITFIPHLLVGQALILFLIMALSDEATMKKPGNWVFLGILAFVEGIVFPPGLVFVVVTIVVLAMLEFLVDGKKLASQGLALRSWILQKIIPRVVALGLALPSLVYLQLMTSFYPWKRLAEFDIVKPLPFEYAEYLKAVGPILPIGLVGLVIAIGVRERRMLPSVAWVLAWALLLFVFQFIPQQSPLRFSEMIPHIPLGVLSAYLFGKWIFAISKFENRYRKTKEESRNISFSNFHFPISITNFHFLYSEFRIFLHRMLLGLSIAAPMVIIVVGLGVMYSSWLWQRDFIDHKMRATYPLVPTGSYVMYPLKDFIAAMKFLQDATSRQTAILSETTAGNYLPVYSGNTVYVGHANTVRAEEKEAIVKQFFSGRMNMDEARASLTRENLRWIFFGPQEKEDGGVGDLGKVYPFLMEAYKNAFVTVYQLL
ncbi:hypothetical protein HY411_00960 [Candidatus Gottesmanbacteria bacterium]|nr:hypothetical protein [Candidatus Gottesmanbacteria bacterium]